MASWAENRWLGSDTMSSERPEQILSTQSAAAAATEVLDSIYAGQAYEIAGKKVYPVEGKTLKKLEDIVTAALSNIDKDEDPGYLLSLLDHIDELKRQNAELDSAAKASMAEFHRVRGDMEKLQESLAAKEKQNKELKSLLEAEKKKLQEQLKVAHEQNLAAKKEELRVRRSADVDAAEAAALRKMETAAEVTRLNNELQAANAKIKGLNEETQMLRNELKTLQDKAMRAKETATAAHLAKDRAKNVLPEKPRSAQVELNSKVLKAVIGDKGIKWLKEAESVQRNDARERAYRLLMSTAGSSNRTIRTLNQVIKIAWEWCKQKSFKARQIILEWLDQIEADIRSFKLKPTRWYRERLEEIIEKAKAKAAQVAPKAKTGGKRRIRFSWLTGLLDAIWKEISIDVRLIFNRSRRGLKWLSSRISSACSRVSAWWQGLWPSANKRHVKFSEEGPRIILFDAEKAGDSSTTKAD